MGSDVRPAEVSSAVVRLGERLPKGFSAGTSSWSFPGWTGLVYRNDAPKARLARDGLRAYAQHPLLRAVGVDRTYYRPVKAEVFRGYAAQVPPSFRFLVKATESLTSARFPRHERYGTRAGRDNPGFLDPIQAAEEVVGPFVEGLGERGGALVFQFPPQDPQLFASPGHFGDAIERFLSALPRGPRYGVELRNRTWLGPDYADALLAHDAVHVYNVHPAMPSIAEQLRAVPGGARNGLVVRWMLHTDFTYERAKARFAPFDRLAAPDPVARGDIARLARAALERDKEVLVIANNKAEGCSPLSVLQLCEALVDAA